MIGQIGFITFIWAGFTLINRILEGQLVTTTEMSIVRSITVFSNYTIAGLNIPIPNLGFITGIARLIKWDYSFFGGSAETLMFFFYAITAAVSFGLFVLAIGTLGSYFVRR